MPRPALASREGYDAVVVGGALAGAAAALLLARKRPSARILVVEPQTAFPRKVGEATVETSAYFLRSVLGLGGHLDLEQLPKHGLRYWFSDDGKSDGGERRRFAELSEVAPRALADVPTFQLDRSRLDEAVLAAAAAAGCEVLRGSRVAAWEEGWPRCTVTIEAASDTGGEAGGEAGGVTASGAGAGAGGAARTVTTRWLIDGSGRHAFVARRKRLLERTEEHPVAALWGRWNGVADLDDPAFLAAHGLPASGEVRRRLATNHFCGYGWWCWVIPLADGATSVGLVHHRELFAPAGETAEQRYRRFVSSRPGLAELVAGAELADFHAYRHLPYASGRYAGRGWALVGDAASFLDPYYSPGLDHLAMSVFASVELVADDLEARDDGRLDAALDMHNEHFRRSYPRWLDALYLGKYELLGDAELTACAYMVDTAFYYMGIVTPLYRHPQSLANPAFGLASPQSEYAWRTMRTFNRRMNRIARFRRATGVYGRRNLGWRRLGPAPGLGRKILPMLASGLWLWLRLEAGMLLGRLRHGRRDLSRPVPAFDVAGRV